MSESDKRYSRVEREILEILDEMESKDEAPRPRNVVEFRRPPRSRIPSIPKPALPRPRSLLNITPARLLLATVALAIGAVLVQGFSGTLATILVLLAIASFLAMFFVRSSPGRSSVSSGPRTKRWRGRDIDLGSGGGGRPERNWRNLWRGGRD